jgi:hypothetical protein
METANSNWTDMETQSCSLRLHLYCFEQPPDADAGP